MPHGAPDFGNVRPKETTFALQDDAELAERLGAVPSLDRLGDVIFIENFEDGLTHWNTEIAGVGESITESGVWAMHGGWSIKIHLPQNSNAYAKLYRSHPYPVVSKIGFEFNATSDEHAEVFIGYITFYTNTYMIKYGVKFDVPGGKVYYLNENGLWVLIAENVYISYANGIFHRGKYIVNLPDLEYDRYTTSAGTTSLKGLKPLILPDTTRSHMAIELFLQGSNLGEIDVYVDSVIITQNEP